MSSLAQRSHVRDRTHGRGAVMAALDIGSSKITCMIARRADATNGEPRVAGAGTQATKGVRSGAVIDLDGLERSIRLAVEQAERAADLRITEVVLGVSGPDLRSDIVRAKLPMGGREVTANHMRDVRVAALESFQPQGREVLHSAPLGFIVDGTAGIRDPRGMFAENLTASFLVVSAPTAGLRNIVQCVSRAHLEVSAILAAPYAAGLACLVEDEAEQGAMVIDFGAGVTSAAAFWEGGLLHVETLPMGGSKATSDLAQGLGTTFAAAERMKIQHGAVGLAESGALDMIEAPRLGPDGRLEAHQCSRADVAQILRPRIVLTGGSSQLGCLKELAEDVFRAPVRLAKPANVKGLGETYSSPAFAAAAGLLRWDLMGGPDPLRTSTDRAASDHGGSLTRQVFGWVQKNF